MIPGIFKHLNCRNGIYPQSTIERLTVFDNLIFWTNLFPLYKPPYYESTTLLNKPWADLKIGDSEFSPKWNSLDGKINRKSHLASGYEISDDGYPKNPFGRTGLCGRGLLGRWGPNHAADPIVTRWKRQKNNNEIVTNEKTGLGILQLIVIQRRDNKMWALPGGIVDPGEQISQTLRREFMEEAMNSSGTTTNVNIDQFFANYGEIIYSGYVDDPRNTDNSWMETVACNFHDSDGSIMTQQLKLEAGDDAGAVRWLDIDETLNLYASHKLFVKKVVDKLNAHWF